MIKQGKKVKVGTKWLFTHKYLKVSEDPIPAAYQDRLTQIMGLLAAAEQRLPSGPGTNKELNIGGKAGIGLTYKWLGKTEANLRTGIIGVGIDAEHYLSVEMSMPPKAYFHKEGKVYNMEVPVELHPVFSEILSRSPAKYLGGEEVQASTGVSDTQAFASTDCIIGVDDSGRGTLAGPFVAAAVMLRTSSPLPEVFDSKVMEREARNELARTLKNSGLIYACVSIPADVIDKIGITQANIDAFDMAIAECERKAGVVAGQVLIDGGKLALKTQRPVSFLTKGESTSRAIAAASVLATSMHEEIMREMHLKYPEWGFDTNLGYGNNEHMRLIKVKDPSEIHRRSFNPLRTRLEKEKTLGKHPTLDLT